MRKRKRKIDANILKKRKKRKSKDNTINNDEDGNGLFNPDAYFTPNNVKSRNDILNGIVSLSSKKYSGYKSHLSDIELKDLYRECIQLNIKNGINKQNSWNLKLIDHIGAIIRRNVMNKNNQLLYQYYSNSIGNSDRSNNLLDNNGNDKSDSEQDNHVDSSGSGMFRRDKLDVNFYSSICSIRCCCENIFMSSG